MKIATAAEPERSEGQRSTFNEVLTQVDKGAILKLCDAAGFAGHKENFEAARIAGYFVTAQRAGEILLRLKAAGEDDGIFDGEAGALAEIGADGMRSVAEDGDATYNPRKSGEAILDTGVYDVFGVGDEIGDRRVPTGKKLLQGGALGEIVPAQRVVGHGIPVDAAGAKAQNAEASPAAVGFGEIAVMIEAESVGAEIRIEIGDSAPDAVVAIAEFGS